MVMDAKKWAAVGAGVTILLVLLVWYLFSRREGKLHEGLYNQLLLLLHGSGRKDDADKLREALVDKQTISPFEGVITAGGGVAGALAGGAIGTYGGTAGIVVGAILGAFLGGYGTQYLLQLQDDKNLQDVYYQVFGSAATGGGN